jgi:hypothetical protein
VKPDASTTDNMADLSLFLKYPSRLLTNLIQGSISLFEAASKIPDPLQYKSQACPSSKLASVLCLDKCIEHSGSNHGGSRTPTASARG